MKNINENCEKIAVIIPCYRVKSHIKSVIEAIPDSVTNIIIVDDACPEQTGLYVQATLEDKRITVLFHEINKGVGAACITGFKAALSLNCMIIVKIDGDGQMDTGYMQRLLKPILSGYADYSKGNRFYHMKALMSMPLIRRIGNGGLSVLTKFASGFWHVSDPTNGYIAFHTAILEVISLDKLAQRYFFESSMLINLNIVGATVCDIPIPAQYGSEKSSLSIFKSFFEFPLMLSAGLVKRIILKYFIYNVNAVSLLLVMGFGLVLFGGAFGILKWHTSISAGLYQSAGTVALSFLPIILGFQMLLQAMVIDIVDRPAFPLHQIITPRITGKKTALPE